MRLAFATNLVLLLGLSLAGCQLTFGQRTTEGTVSSELDKCLKDSKTRFTDTVLVWFLPDVFDCAKVPAGLSISYDGRNLADRFDFTPKSFSLEAIIETALSKEQGYTWKNDNGVINVLPEAGYRLLNQRVGRFRVEKVTASQAVGALFTTSTISSYLESNKLREGDTAFYGFSVVNREKELSIDLENPSVLEALNEIVRADGSSRWTYYEMDSIVDGTTSRSYKVSVKRYK